MIQYLVSAKIVGGKANGQTHSVTIRAWSERHAKDLAVEHFRCQYGVDTVHVTSVGPLGQVAA